MDAALLILAGQIIKLPAGVGDAYYIDRSYKITALNHPAGAHRHKTANADKYNSQATFLTFTATSSTHRSVQITKLRASTGQTSEVGVLAEGEVV
jgi:hypothetical protein